MTALNFATLKNKANDALSWWKQTRIARTLRQYGLANGALLSGGITYKAIFSLFAALTIGFTVFVRFLGNDDELRNSVVETVNKAVPGLIETSEQQGLLPLDSLVLSTGMNITSVIAAAVLLWSVISAMESIRSSVRAMFSLPPAGDSAVAAKIRSFLGFVGVALGVLITSVAGIAVNGALQYLDRFITLGSASKVLVTLGSFTVSFILDALLFIVIVRLLCGVKAPRSDLLWGAGIAAVGFGVIRYLGTSVVVGSAANNPVFKTAAVLVTLLVWLYLCARILLTAAAFTANPPLNLLEHIADESRAVAKIDEARELDARTDSSLTTIATIDNEPTGRARGRWPRTVAVLIIGLVLGRITARRLRTSDDQTQ